MKNLRSELHETQPQKVHSADGLRELAELRRFANVLDSAYRIPFTSIRFGLDAILGLVPGVGDLLATLLALSIVYRGWRLGTGLGNAVKMVGNLSVDLIVGVIPFQAILICLSCNQRNIALTEKGQQPKTSATLSFVSNASPAERGAESQLIA